MRQIGSDEKERQRPVSAKTWSNRNSPSLLVGMRAGNVLWKNVRVTSHSCVYIPRECPLHPTDSDKNVHSNYIRHSHKLKTAQMSTHARTDQ